MKIAFIGYQENSINIFKELSRALSKKIANLELEERFVPMLEDIPEVALECSKEADFIFVFALVDSEGERNLLKGKLIDVELKTEVRILKAIDEDEFSNQSEEKFLVEKDEAVEKYADMIVSILFNEIAFEPKDKDFGL